jgi:hypothetical protein
MTRRISLTSYNKFFILKGSALRTLCRLLKRDKPRVTALDFASSLVTLLTQQVKQAPIFQLIITFHMPGVWPDVFQLETQLSWIANDGTDTKHPPPKPPPEDVMKISALVSSPRDSLPLMTCISLPTPRPFCQSAQ